MSECWKYSSIYLKRSRARSFAHMHDALLTKGKKRTHFWCWIQYVLAFCGYSCLSKCITNIFQFIDGGSVIWTARMGKSSIEKLTLNVNTTEKHRSFFVNIGFNFFTCVLSNVFLCVYFLLNGLLVIRISRYVWRLCAIFSKCFFLLLSQGKNVRINEFKETGNSDRERERKRTKNSEDIFPQQNRIFMTKDPQWFQWQREHFNTLKHVPCALAEKKNETHKQFNSRSTHSRLLVHFGFHDETKMKENEPIP